MRPIDADILRMVFASGIRVYDGMCKIEDVMHNIDNAPTIDADAYFDAVDRVKACPNCRYTHIHKMLSESGQTPWKSFAEEKPNKRGNYIVFTNKGNVYISTWNMAFKRWSGRMNNAVTHWMHLPMGPEEV